MQWFATSCIITKTNPRGYKNQRQDHQDHPGICYHPPRVRWLTVPEYTRLFPKTMFVQPFATQKLVNSNRETGYTRRTNSATTVAVVFDYYPLCCLFSPVDFWERGLDLLCGIVVLAWTFRCVQMQLGALTVWRIQTCSENFWNLCQAVSVLWMLLDFGSLLSIIVWGS